ncbi:Os03g0176200, partial [Oryza sativa Japonica Group]
MPATGRAAAAAAAIQLVVAPSPPPPPLLSPASNFMACAYCRPCSRCAPRWPSEAVSELSDAPPPPALICWWSPGATTTSTPAAPAGASGGSMRVGERRHARSPPMRWVLEQMRFTSYLLMSKLVTAFRPRNLIAAMSYASAASSCVPA